MKPSLRERNNASRMKNYEKEKEDKYWHEYEHQAIQKHIQDNPTHTMYHWENMPENLLEDSGYINDKNETRKKRIIARAKERAKNNQTHNEKKKTTTRIWTRWTWVLL